MPCGFPGFHLGNSPLEMTEAAVRGKTLVVTTTNGTQALLACQGAAAVYPACAANLSLAAERAREALDSGQRPLDRLRRPGGRASRWTTPTAAGRLVAAALGGTAARAAGSTTRRSRPRPGPPLRRRLGAPAAAKPRRPGAAPAGLRRRRAAARTDGCLSGAARISTSGG